MQEYRVLIFRGSRLHRSEVVQSGDFLEAVQASGASSADERIEVWSETGRIASFGLPRGRKHL